MDREFRKTRFIHIFAVACLGALSGCYLEATMKTHITSAGATALNLAEGPATVTYTKRDTTDCESKDSIESCRHDAILVTDQSGHTAVINDIDSSCERTYGFTDEIHYSFLKCTGRGHFGDAALNVKASFSERPLYYPYFLMTLGEIRDQTDTALIQKAK